jgi:Asp/Glu/hydantoin racemase
MRGASKHEASAADVAPLAPLVVCVHATSRAIGPAIRLLTERPGEYRIEHLLDERLLDAADDDAASQALFLEVLQRAEARRPDLILTTCSMYTRHLPTARAKLALPLVGIDEPLLERAALLGGRLALVGSLATSIRLSEEAILAIARSRGIAIEITTRHFVAPEIASDRQALRRLADELRWLKREADVVVVVQLSLSPVANHLTEDEQQTILTSAKLAAAHLRDVARGRAQ